MAGWLTAACLLLPGQATPTQTLFVPVMPAPGPGGTLVRSAGQDRAVVLIHGLELHPIDDAAVPRAELVSWQRPDAALVKALARDADVFAFAYGQSVPVGDVAELPGLSDGVRQLR